MFLDVFAIVCKSELSRDPETGRCFLRKFVVTDFSAAMVKTTEIFNVS